MLGGIMYPESNLVLHLHYHPLVEVTMLVLLDPQATSQLVLQLPLLPPTD